MSLKRSRVLRLASLLLVLGWGSASQAADFLLTPADSAGELQIGTGLPLPIGPPGVFLGGMTSINGGTSCGMGAGMCQLSPDGPGKAYWPPLFVPAAATAAGQPNVTISQTLGTAQGGAIVAPTGALSVLAPGAPVPIAVFPTNPAVFQVATTISYAWPAPGGATLAPGGGPGIPAGTVSFNDVTLGFPIGAGASITYSGSTKAFGGPGQFAIGTGAGGVGGRVPVNGMGVTPLASVWINFAGGLPTTAMAIAIVGAENLVGLGQPGAPIGAIPATTMFGPLTPGAGPFGALNVGSMTAMGTGTGGPCVAFCVTPAGGIPSSAPLPSIMLGPTTTLNGLSNMVTASLGFPWSTGLITLAQPAAGPAETFWLSGTDMRVAGVGNVSLVSGALSTRALSGPNGNRGWLSLTLPEPTMALGAVAALGMLGLCHGLVRRRSR